MPNQKFHSEIFLLHVIVPSGGRFRHRLGSEGAAALDLLTTHYLAERFGARPPTDLTAPLRALEDAVDRMRLRNQPDVGETPLGARQAGQ